MVGVGEGRRLPPPLAWGPMARFLTPAWIAELDRRVGADASLQRATDDVSLVIQQVVTGGPDGDVAYHVDLDHGAATVRSGTADRPDVTFRQDYATAVAIGSGELSAQAAFMVGKLIVGGDVGMLLTNQRAFDGVEDIFASVRAATEY